MSQILLLLAVGLLLFPVAFLLLWLRIPLLWLKGWPEPALIFTRKAQLLAFNERARLTNPRLKKGDRLDAVLPENVLLDREIQFQQPLINYDAGTWGSLSHTRLTVVRLPRIMGGRIWVRVVDDSDNFQRHAKLARQLALLEATLDAIPLILLIKDERGRYVRLNKAGRNYMGSPNVTGKETDADFFSPEVVERHRQWESRIQLTSIPLHRHEIDEKAEEPSSLELYIAPLVRDMDKARFFIYLVQDDTRRLSQELSLYQWQQRLMTLINALPQYVFFRDQREQTLIVNHRAQHMLELPDQVVSIQAALRLLTLESQQALQDHLNQVIERRVECDVRAVVDFTDGRRVLLEGRMIPMFDRRTGKLDAVLSLYEDFTESSDLDQSMQLVRQRIESLVQTDQLTGVANNEYLRQYIEAQWQLLAKEQGCLALLVCEIDHFDTFRDFYGNLAADRAQVEVAQHLRSLLQRPRDLLGRSGDGQFLLVLPGCNWEGVELVANRLLSAMQTLQINHDHSPVATFMTLSIGGVWEQPDATATQRSESELKANKAMTVAQIRGGNQVVIVPERETGRDQR